MEDFVKFNINLLDGGHQAVLDPLIDSFQSGEPEPLNVYRDFDSLLGFDKDILIEGSDLAITPLPDFRLTLRSNVHISYSFFNPR